MQIRVWEQEILVINDQIGKQEKIEIDHTGSPPSDSSSAKTDLDLLQNAKKASRGISPQ
jgi:hypothetical protein